MKDFFSMCHKQFEFLITFSSSNRGFFNHCFDKICLIEEPFHFFLWTQKKIGQNFQLNKFVVNFFEFKQKLKYFLRF